MKTILNSRLLNAICLVMVLSVCLPGIVTAHIMTDTSQFPDVKSSDARFDILVLVGAGVIPETAVFEPQKKFSRSDLAAWGALASNFLKKGEGTPAALVKVALEKGLVKSIEGDATYAEINTVFFQGKLQPAQPDAIPTKAEAASYIATGLAKPVAGSLLEQSGQRAGPTGLVAKVESKSNADGGESFFVTIGDTTLPMYTHGRVGNGPADIAKWSGRTVRRSFIRTQGEFSAWAYLESETVAGDVDEPMHDHASHSHDEGAANKKPEAEHEHAE